MGRLHFTYPRRSLPGHVTSEAYAAGALCTTPSELLTMVKAIRDGKIIPPRAVENFLPDMKKLHKTTVTAMAGLSIIIVSSYAMEGGSPDIVLI